ncbi:hypothetical protein [Parasitella parasitica]|uniref:Uncharacterized protein n=1 Tax=Parasitella parasitica TaxID=35722 RepID=A0A0B7NNC0_9FUNG|nr:hypothetical protein [Parasitella parasitica]
MLPCFSKLVALLHNMHQYLHLSPRHPTAIQLSSKAPAPPNPTPPTTTINKSGFYLFAMVFSNQEFQHVYLPIRTSKSFKKIRAEPQKAALHNGSIIDINYPISKIIALLVHNDYAPAAKARLRPERMEPILNFDLGSKIQGRLPSDGKSGSGSGASGAGSSVGCEKKEQWTYSCYA